MSVIARLGRAPRARPASRWRAALASLLVLAAIGCTGDDGSAVGADGVTTASTGPCTAERHIVAFDYFGTMTMSDDDLGAWLADPAVVPPARPGAAPTVTAYRDRGYEVLYLTTAPAEIQLQGRPIGLGIGDWLVQNGFPTGAGTLLWVWDGTHTPMRGIAAELDRLTGAGATIDAAYTDNEDKAFAFKTAVPSGLVFTLGAAAATTGATPIPGDDMTAHATEITAQPPACAAT